MEYSYCQGNAPTGFNITLNSSFAWNCVSILVLIGNFITQSGQKIDSDWDGRDVQGSQTKGGKPPGFTSPIGHKSPTCFSKWFVLRVYAFFSVVSSKLLYVDLLLSRQFFQNRCQFSKLDALSSLLMYQWTQLFIKFYILFESCDSQLETLSG